MKFCFTFYDQCISFLGTLRLPKPQWMYHKSGLSLQPCFLHHESWICRKGLKVLNKGKSKKAIRYYQTLWYISLITIWRGREEVNSAMGGYQKLLNRVVRTVLIKFLWLFFYSVLVSKRFKMINCTRSLRKHFCLLFLLACAL